MKIKQNNPVSLVLDASLRFAFSLKYYECRIFILFYFIFKLYIIVLVLPNIKMNQECRILEETSHKAKTFTV